MANTSKCIFSALFPYFLQQWSIPIPLFKFIILLFLVIKVIGRKKLPVTNLTKFTKVFLAITLKLLYYILKFYPSLRILCDSNHIAYYLSISMTIPITTQQHDYMYMWPDLPNGVLYTHNFKTRFLLPFISHINGPTAHATCV